MEIYVIRHADAVPQGEQGIVHDEDRPLTDVGRAQAQQVANFFLKRSLGLDRVVVSPLVRSRQSAEPILQTLGISDVVTCEHASPNGEPKRLAKFLKKLGSGRVALVSHLPFVAVFSGWLMGNKRAQLDFQKGAVALISTGPDVDKATGTLQWLLQPEFLGS